MSTQPAETLTPDDKPSARPLLSAVTLGRGLAVIRILLGLTYLLNGLAKVFDVRQTASWGSGPRSSAARIRPASCKVRDWSPTAARAPRYR